MCPYRYQKKQQTLRYRDNLWLCVPHCNNIFLYPSWEEVPAKLRRLIKMQLRQGPPGNLVDHDPGKEWIQWTASQPIRWNNSTWQLSWYNPTGADYNESRGFYEVIDNRWTPKWCITPRCPLQLTKIHA